MIDSETLRHIYDETRKYLGHDDDRAPVPRDEIVEQGIAEGYDRRTIRDAVSLTVERGDFERSDEGIRPAATTVENPTKEPGSSETKASNPRVDATQDAAHGDVDEGRVLDAFETAVEFYHEHLDDELPDECDVEADTPREYFEDVRGWDADTLDEKRLGYAPAGHGHKLLDRLMSEGFDREEILGTGLFYEGLTPHFHARPVFPYFDEDGDRAVYGIARDIGHPDDHEFLNGKYAKAQVNKDYSHVEEPLYGLDTLDEDTETVLVAEGMPDAITAHELGNAAVSPVTTQFKRKHHDVLLDAVEVTDARVVVVADNDPVGSDFDEDDERLELPQHGEGLKGALRTADFLVENGVDARVAVPPTVAHHENDLDDFVLEGWGTLDQLVATAKPPSQFDAYADVKETREERVERAREMLETDTSDMSSIFDLRLTDVLGVSAGYRGKNPLGHRGTRENYFVAVDDTVAYDHKRKTAYNGLTALLVEAGVRPVDSPDGRLDNDEVFTAWKYAKQERYIPDDDKIPRRALRHIAETVTGWDGSLVERERRDGETFEGLPTDVYNAALDYVEDNLGLETGQPREQGGAKSGGHAALLPNVERDELRTSGFVDYGTRDVLDAARDRTEEKVVGAVSSGDRLILEALPTLGKSRGAVKAAAETDEPVTILTSRKELYEQVEDKGDEFGVEVQRLPSFFDECPTASGAHGNEWKERVKKLYNSGATGRDIHAYAEPPCQEDGSCPYSRAWDGVDEDADVLVGHYVHAYVPKVRSGRTLVFDEFPEEEFTHALEGDEFKRAVSAYLDTVESVPFDDFTDLLENRDDDERRARAVEYLTRDTSVLCDTERAVYDENFHAYAPAAVLGLLASDDLGNGWEHAALDEDEADGVTFDREATSVYVHDAPDLGYSRGVVCLDGTPTPEMWETALGTRLNHTQVLTDEERKEYVREGLNHSVVQTTEYVKPYSSGENVNVPKDTALLEAVGDKHDRDVDLITTMSARHAYPGDGDDGRAVEIDGVDAVEHYGNLKGSNQFEKSRLGAVVGSCHYGDRYVEKWGAFMGEAVERGDEKGRELSYGETGDKIHRHMTEHETVQAVLRFGRDGNGALVYVATSALPEWVPCDVTPPECGDVVRRTRSDAERDVIRALTEDGKQTVRELTAVVDVTARQVRNITEKLDDEGLVEREKIGRGYECAATCDAYDAPETADVDLEGVELDAPVDEVELVEKAEVLRTIVNTWNFRQTRASGGRSDEDGADGGIRTSGAVAKGAEPPPNDD